MSSALERMKAAQAGTKAPVKEPEIPIKKQTLYLPEPVWEVLRDMAHVERVSQQHLFKEGIDTLLQLRGQASWDEIVAEEIEKRKGGT